VYLNTSLVCPDSWCLCLEECRGVMGSRFLIYVDDREWIDQLVTGLEWGCEWGRGCYGDWLLCRCVNGCYVDVAMVAKLRW